MKLSEVNIYGRKISDFLLPDQIEIIQKKLDESAPDELTAAQERIKELESLLNRASSLVGNPETKGSIIVDLACESWHEDYKKTIKQ